MSDRLRELRVLALDAQASGATPAQGDLLEIGWGTCSAERLVAPAESRWLVPRSTRPVRRAVRELTGWSEACLAQAVDENAAWKLLCDYAAAGFTRGESGGVPTVIHFARFELGFLRDLHERLGQGEPFPFDAVCLHAVVMRFLPDLPRRNIRALAGYFGHSPELLRRSPGHVEATAYIWKGVIPLLEAAGVQGWPELKQWLRDEKPAARSSRRSFPLAAERRRSLPDSPGVYRFLRPNGEVVYVGKAVSLKRRVASHFKSRGPATERSLELLSQVNAIEHTETASLLEAALLETDEIKRLDPPYNVQLRVGERSAWFASRDLCRAAPAPDPLHRLGPLPSERALASFPALARLLDGEPRTPALLAQVLAVPVPFLPDPALFEQGFGLFVGEHFASGQAATTLGRVSDASLALYLARGRTEVESRTEGDAFEWDLARVRRRLERTLVQTGLLLRRARLLSLLADADVVFREPAGVTARVLVISGTEVTARADLASLDALSSLPLRRAPSLENRQRAFDAAAYDRMRVLLTELRRVFDEGGGIALRVAGHLLTETALARVMRTI